jgi:hypothetical protein
MARIIMVKVCSECGKRSYRTQSSAIGVALRCSRARGIGLRIYRCPHRYAWHLTKRPTSTAPRPDARTPPTGRGYRSQVAAAILSDPTVDESMLVAIAAGAGYAHYSVQAARTLINTWCYWGLVYANGSTITAIDVDALREIADHGWNRWLAARSAQLTTSGATHDF